jgi:hypothetical protein
VTVDVKQRANGLIFMLYTTYACGIDKIGDIIELAFFFKNNLGTRKKGEELMRKTRHQQQQQQQECPDDRNKTKTKLILSTVRFRRFFF